MLAASRAGLFQRLPGLDGTVGLFALLMDLANLVDENTILLAVRRLFTPCPVVIPAAADLENSAHALELELFAVGSHKGVLHLSSLAKYAAAFF